MGPLRGETFIFIDIPKDVQMDEFKERFEYWMDMISIVMPSLHANLKEHLEVDYVKRTITHDGNFDDVTNDEKIGTTSALKLIARR